jgi:hypothetical protein
MEASQKGNSPLRAELDRLEKENQELLQVVSVLEDRLVLVVKEPEKKIPMEDIAMNDTTSPLASLLRQRRYEIEDAMQRLKSLVDRLET